MTRVLLALLPAVLAVAVLPGAASAQESPEQELADRYAPILKLREQEDECDTEGEAYEPTAVDIVLDNPQILLRQVGVGDAVIQAAPTGADLFDLGEGFFLDFPGDALDPGCVFEKDFRRYADDRPSVVYAHVATQDDRPDRLALQYWFFWYYNDWNNKHEGDWEGIQLLFDVGTVEEALATDPVSIGYAQHEGGERADWDAGKLERQGTRPVVYSSAGSHASYFGSALYLGRSGSEGFGCDITDGPSRIVDPQVVVLPDTADDPADPHAWLAYEGHWGEQRFGPYSGPTGPASKERWTAPVDWHDELRGSSVVVPGGDSAANSIINTFCGAVETGSAVLLILRENPAVLLVVLVVGGSILGWLLRRTDWSRVPSLPVVRPRRAGQLIRAAGALLRTHPGSFLAVGLIYLPLSLVVAAIVGLVTRLPLVAAFLEGEQEVGLIGAFLLIAFGLLGHSIGFTVARGAVDALISGLQDGESYSARESYRIVFGRIAPLLGALGRMVGIVTVLFVSVIGIPWGIRQLVRYLYVPDAVVLEGSADGRSALARSSELVKGRWFRTAVVFVVVNLVVLLGGTVLGLVLLLVTTGLPLWVFSLLVTTVGALLTPYSAAAVTLLYGDARAAEARSAQEPAEPATV